MVKNPPANAGDGGDESLIPGWGRSPGEETGNPLQYSCLEKSMNRGALQSTVHGVTELDTAEQLSHMQSYKHKRIVLIIMAFRVYNCIKVSLIHQHHQSTVNLGSFCSENCSVK